jgi:hypothetical protein
LWYRVEHLEFAALRPRAVNHDIAEILLKVALKHQKSKIKSISSMMLEIGFETKKMATWCHILQHCDLEQSTTISFHSLKYCK